MARMTGLLALVAAVGLVGAALAAPPSTMSYQGVLRDADGNVVADGNYSMTFKIYDVSSGGTALWTETQSVSVAGGIFNAILGKTSALNLAFDAPYWLGISVGGGAELSPRVELTSSPYALRAAVADSAAVAGVSDDGDWEMGSGNVWRSTGNVGIGTSTPASPLDVNGTAKVVGFQMPTGAVAGSVLTSDASGTGSWQTLPGGIGGSGTTDNFAMFTSPTTIGSSTVFERYGTVTIPDNTGRAVPLEGSGKKGDRSPFRLDTRLGVYDQNGWTSYAAVYETNTNSDGRSAIYGYRDRTIQNNGAAYGHGFTNNAITGYNAWGDNYTFGVAGYSENESGVSGGVLGADADGTYWGALGYMDLAGTTWGVYTPYDIHVGGTLVGLATNATYATNAGNADQLDSQHGAYYQNATNLNAGTVAEARLPQNAIDGSELEDGGVLSADIADGTIANADVSASAAIADTKISGTAWTHSGDGYPSLADYNYAGGFFTTSGSYATVTSVGITLTAASVVHGVGNAWAGYWDGTYEAQIGIGFDSTTAEYYSERRYDIASQQDLTVTSSFSKELSAGSHTIYFVAYRVSGTGQVWMPRFSLTVECTDLVAKSEGESRPEPVPAMSAEEGYGTR